MAQLIEQRLEQVEGLGLVFVQRIALAIATQADDTAQVVQMDQMLAPLHVDHLQQELLLEAAGLFRADLLQALARAGVGGGDDPFLDLLVGDAFLGGPVVQGQLQTEGRLHLLVQAVDVPLLGIGLGRHMLLDQVGDDVVAEFADQFGQVGRVHELLALLEHGLALVVHDVVVFQQVLADVVVAGLDPLLGGLDGAVQPGVADRLAFGHAEAAHDGVQTVAGEDAQQVVLAGQEEFRGAGVALTAGAAAQLVVDAAALVALGAEDEQAAGGQRLLLLNGDVGLQTGLFRGFHLRRDFLRQVAQVLTPFLQAHFEVAAQLDVGAAAGHVGGDGHHARQACVGDDIGFLLMLAGVQNAVRNALARLDFDVEILVLQGLIGLLRFLADLLVLACDRFQQMGVLGLQRLEGDLILVGLQQLGQGFRFFDRHGADEDRLALDVAFGDQGRNGLVLLGCGAEDFVVVVDALDRTIGWHLEDIHLVDVQEFLGLGRRRAGHA